MRRLEAWVIAATLVLGGCIGAAAQGTPAMEHRGTADEEAYATSEGAELVAVHGAEANETWDEREDTRERTGNVSIHGDRIGDGAAAVWVYEYRTPNATIEVVVNEAGEVVRTDRGEDVDEDERAIEDLQVSSIEAAEIVQENDDNWTVDDDGMAFYNLEHEEEAGDPIWSMVQFHHDTGVLWARVNAATGAFVGSGTLGGFGGSWGGWSGWGGWGWGGGGEGPGNASEGPPQEGGSFSGTVSATDDTREHAFTIDAEDHRSLGVRLQAEDPGAGGLEATIEGPEGELGTLSAGSAGSSTDRDAWDDPEEGDYTITVELTDGVERGYRIDWCADGQPTGGEASEACDRVHDDDRGERATAALVPR